MYLIGGTVLGAVLLALWERRKGRKIRQDAVLHGAQLTQRSAHTQSERIRAEGVALHTPSSGYH